MFYRRMSSLPDQFWPAATLVLVAVSAGACSSSARQTQATIPATPRAAPHQVRVAAQAEVAGAACPLQSVYFAFDSSMLDEPAREALSRNAACLRRQQRERVKLVGMTDDRGTEEYNAALGERRARIAAQYLASLGVEEQRMMLHSMGEELATGNDEEGWARDRRAQIERD